MTQSKLIEKLGGHYPDLAPKEIQALVVAFFRSVKDALARGDKVEIRGFGSFRVRYRKPRVGRNPRTGDPVMVSEKRVPFFKAGRELKALVDQGAGDAPPSQ